LSLFVVDASVVAKWFVPERHSDDAARLLDDQHELASPDLMWAEISNVLWKKSRAGQVTGQEAARIIRALDDFPVTVFPSRLVLEGALEIALGTGRSVYDSVYLALAIALDCRLVTADERFANALADGPLGGHVLWVGMPGRFN
jgi:predicted nucleic acid-binding protein